MKRALLVLAAGCGRIGFDAAPGDPEMFPVVYTLDAIENGRVASSWPAFDGYCQPSVCPTVQPGIRDGALQFDGAQGIYLPTPTLVGAAPFTVTVWISPSTIGDIPRTVIAKPISSGSMYNSFALFIDADRRLQLEGAAVDRGDYLTAPTPVTTDWHHIAASWDGVNRSLFLDGNLEAVDVPGGHEDVAYPMFIGADIDEDTIHGPFAGLIDEVRFYDRALEPAEIAALAMP
jgi:hypothetical protein